MRETDTTNGKAPSAPKPGPRRADLSPEARRIAALADFGSDRQASAIRRLAASRIFQVIKRVTIGTFNDGFIHAGNLAYMSMLTIFPFFILGAAIFSAIGEEAERAASIGAVVAALPPMVGDVIEPVARNVVEKRSGWLLWVGGFIGLWTVSSLVETIRDLLRRAYGTDETRAYWRYRLFSAGITIGAVLLVILSLFAQVMIGAAQEFIAAYFPQFVSLVGQLAWSRIVPAVALFGAIYLLFLTLTPAKYRQKRYPKWPGALLVTLWWAAVTVIMPPVLRNIFTYDLTYGSLAGIMIALFFFWLVGLGIVAGAELNAALAETPEEEKGRLGRTQD